ncbi:MAG: hypothetical protein J7L39_01055, partial [Candidatus Aenigmarchaeota archaeon]|nr:hypothetical protein [Candidatus Aenigmarchaeota archaeon]
MVKEKLKDVFKKAGGRIKNGYSLLTGGKIRDLEKRLLEIRNEKKPNLIEKIKKLEQKKEKIEFSPLP